MNAGDAIEVINSGWTFSGQTATHFDPHVVDAFLSTLRAAQTTTDDGRIEYDI